jgi:hypothetical protein
MVAEYITTKCCTWKCKTVRSGIIVMIAGWGVVEDTTREIRTVAPNRVVAIVLDRDRINQTRWILLT